MAININKSRLSENEFRYERKFLVPDLSYELLQQYVKTHPAQFKSIYHERHVNNIYFDTLNYENYYANVDGEMNRLKFRIRWYGDLFSDSQTPVLEVKIRKGYVGTKQYVDLPPLTMGSSFSQLKLMNWLKGIQLPDSIRYQLLRQVPSLINRYKRCYFLSADRQFRISIDDDISVFSPLSKILGFPTKLPYRVLEVKYSTENNDLVSKITSKFPFRMTRSSKYVDGLNFLKESHLSSVAI